MKKLLAVAAGVLALGSISVGVAGADNAALTTPLGSVGVNQDGYVVVADGNSENEDPLDGYIGLTEGGCVGATDGGPYNDDGTDNADHVDSPCEAPAP